EIDSFVVGSRGESNRKTSLCEEVRYFPLEGQAPETPPECCLCPHEPRVIVLLRLNIGGVTREPSASSGGHQPWTRVQETSRQKESDEDAEKSAKEQGKGPHRWPVARHDDSVSDHEAETADSSVPVCYLLLLRSQRRKRVGRYLEVLWARGIHSRLIGTTGVTFEGRVEWSSRSYRRPQRWQE